MDIKNLSIEGVSFWGEHQNNKGGIRIHWSCNKGFGTLDIFMEKDGIIHADTESMGKEFADMVLKELINQTKSDVTKFEEPERTEWPKMDKIEDY